MKKISTLFMGLIIALSAVAAPQLNEKDFELLKAKKEMRVKTPFQSFEKAAPIKQVRRALLTKQDAAFAFDVDSVSSHAAKVIVTPTGNQTYYWGVMPKAAVDTLSDDQIVANIKDEMDYYILIYAYFYQMELTYADFLVTGVDAYKYTDLEANTEYAAYAVLMDANASATGAVEKFYFSTPEFILPEGGDYVMTVANEAYYSSTNDVWVRMADEAGNTYYFDILLNDSTKTALESGVSYALASMDERYTYATYEGEKLRYTAASLTKTIAANGDYVIAASFVDTLGSTWNLTYTYIKPVKSREETLTIANGAITLYNGAWQLMAANADASRFISLAASTTELAGQYAIDDLLEDYSYVVALGADTNYFDLVDAAVTITYNEAAGTAHIAGTLLAQSETDKTDVPEFTLDITATVKAAGKDYDVEDADFIHNFATYSIDDTYLEKYGSVYVFAQDGNDFGLVLDITLDEGEEELFGVYPVADEYDYQTVYAGYYDSEYGLIPSFAGTLIEDGGQLYYDKLWFLTEGKVIVNADGSIDVEAVNSYGRTIRCHLAKAEGVENTNTEVNAAKVLRNGQLIIIKNGVEYNAIGTIVK